MVERRGRGFVCMRIDERAAAFLLRCDNKTATTVVTLTSRLKNRERDREMFAKPKPLIFC